MATKTRFSSQTQSTSTIDDAVSYSDADLQQAYESFIQEEPEAENSRIFNIASAFGIAMLLVSAVYFMQIIGIPFGPDLSEFMSGLPIFGGIFVALTGLGFVLREHPKRKGNRAKYQQMGNSYSATSSSSKPNTGSSNLEESWNNYKKNSTKSRTGNSLGSQSYNRPGTTTFQQQKEYDEYALKQSKKLFKSRKDKKISGVCGGLAKYFGLSSTVVRLIFVLSTIFFPVFNGMPVVIYIILSFVLNKEPKILEEK